MSADPIILGIVLMAASGLSGLGGTRSPVWGEGLAMMMMIAGAVLGITVAWPILFRDQNVWTFFPWPAAGNSVLGVDALSAFFLVPVFLVGGLGSIYGLGYWPQRQHMGDGHKLRFFWGTLTAGMALLVISRHAMAFLLGWEMMALSAFFLVGTQNHRDECRRAAWIYLIATHAGTLTLFALFAMWRWATGSYDLAPVAHETMNLGVMNGLFFLALFVFGLKAGLMPLHFWLPGAHASAPSHVSAMLSGVVLKMGIYGLLRMLSLFTAPPPAWGTLILLLGAVSGLLGVVFAIGQHDLKRLLAYHSVENIGIILLGLGLAMLGRSGERPEWVALGLAGCLLHVWNHSLFKSLLFLCAGNVIRATHTRGINHLGGLARTMPWTAAMFLVGAVAICGLPPLNGFVSELFVYLGLLRTAVHDGAMSGSNAPGTAVLAAPVLAMIGALAVACFVKVYGAVFLGMPRSGTAAQAHEAPLTMCGPIFVLAACCALIGLAPVLVVPILDNVMASWMRETGVVLPSLGTIAPLGAVSAFSMALIVCVATLTMALALRKPVSRGVGTWDCGFARPTSRMQYTASSFAQMIVAMFHWVLRPQEHRPDMGGNFPRPTKMHSHVDDAVLDRLLVPAGRNIERWFGSFRRLQQGLTQHYVLYILITVVLMLSALMPFEHLITWLFAR